MASGAWLWSADGSSGSLPAKLACTDVLVLDGFAMAPTKDSARRDFLEICDDRYQLRSTILIGLAFIFSLVGSIAVCLAMVGSRADRDVRNTSPASSPWPRFDAGK